MTNFREDMGVIHVSVAGVALDNNPWDSKAGGWVEATTVQHRPGGMAPRLELGGPAARTDVTVERLYTDAQHANIIALDNVAGRAAAQVSWTPLDADGLPSGSTVTYTGILKSVMAPNLDSNASAAAKLGLVIGVNQQATAAN